MCGIVGIVSDDRPVDRDLLLRMRDTLAHRGPDDAGGWLSPDGKIGLAHRRLSILDLTPAGHQPMSDADENLWITFNGEIYNFQQIARELETLGCRFKSRTDTEVILHAYRQWGTDCLAKFNGMFAFGLYDTMRKIVFFARDRIGKKPLYYRQSGNSLHFASEIKALAVHPDFSREINLDALNFYLTYGYIPGELCIFSHVKKLPPAHAMTFHVESGDLKKWRYWQLPAENPTAAGEPEILEELETLLQDAVKLRMISDVPLGVFLSGGVDSSLVTALMARVSDRPVKTFSIGFEERTFNELPYARIVADHFGTEHTELIVKPDFLEILPKLCRQYDEPFGDSSMIPTYYVSRETRKFVTVALGGDGGDELFGGYTTYLAGRGAQALSKILPGPLRSAVAALAQKLPPKFTFKRHLERLRFDGPETFLAMAGYPYFKRGIRELLLTPLVLEQLGNNLYHPELSRLAAVTADSRQLVNALEAHDFLTYLPDDIMVKVDRASMLNSLEVRAPILDYRVAEFAFGKIPGRLKIKGMTLKFLLKQMAKKILPQQLNINRKQGFSIPISRWFREPLNRQVTDILMESRLPWFDPVFLRRLLQEHQAGIDHGWRLYTLLVLVLWAQEYGVK